MTTTAPSSHWASFPARNTKGTITIFATYSKAKSRFHEQYPATVVMRSKHTIRVQIDGVTPDGTIYPNELGTRMTFKRSRKGRWVLKERQAYRSLLSQIFLENINKGSVHFTPGIQTLRLLPF